MMHEPKRYVSYLGGVNVVLFTPNVDRTETVNVFKTLLTLSAIRSPTH